MTLKANITNADEEGIDIEVYRDDVFVKTIHKSYSSLASLYGLVTTWYPTQRVPKYSDPNGFFAPPVGVTKRYNQAFLDAVTDQFEEKSFPVSSFFRLYDLEGKVVIITGASSGIGKQNAYQLADMGAHVILACRSEQKTLPIVEDIKKETGNENVEYMHLDLLELDTVRAFADSFKSRNLPLHVLINNAGGVFSGTTSYNFDKTFGVNHVGPVLLTMSLLDILNKTENARIIFVSSTIATKVTEMPYERIKAGITLSMLNPTEAYGYSKLANIMFVKSLANRIAEEAGKAANAETTDENATDGNSKNSNSNGKTTRVFSLHPGAVATDIYREIPSAVSSVMKQFMISDEEGSYLTLCLAVDDECNDHSGSYFHYKRGIVPEPVPLAEYKALQKFWWDETLELAGIKDDSYEL